MPNIENYELLDDNTKDYFDQNNFMILDDEAFGQNLLTNEPKGDGKDFLMMSSSLSSNDELETDQDSLNDIFKDKMAYKGSFLGYETESDQDEFCIKIRTTKLDQVDETNDIIKSVIKPFNLLLRAENEGTKSCDETVAAFEDSEIIRSIECLKSFPRGLQDYLLEFGFFQKQTASTGDDGENIASQIDELSELHVPGVSSSQEDISSMTVEESSSQKQSLRDVTNESSYRSLRSSSRTSIHKEDGNNSRVSIKSGSNQGSGRTFRTKPLIVGTPSVNARMDSFAAGFKPNKRRRASLSPENRDP